METELAQFSNLAEEASGESPLLHEHFQAHNDLGITEELGVSSKPPKKGALAKPIRNKNWKGLSSDLNPFARGRPRRPFLRSITHDITKSPFDPPFKKLPELLQFIRENRSLDPQTFSRFMIKFLDDNPKALKQILEQDDLRPHLTDRYILKESFTRLHDIFAEDAASEERIAALSRQLSKEMRSISLPEETYSDPVSVLGKKLAAYRFKSLATDREILKSNYLTRKQQYLTHLLGFMGHRNVLAPYIEAAFKEEIKSGTLVLKQEMTEQQIVEKLDVIQMELAKLTGLHRDFVSGSRVQGFHAGVEEPKINHRTSPSISGNGELPLVSKYSIQQSS
ncbi:hypothetical protein PCANC_06608 [Puccinia coronata f. sp. avenae]|uniref:Uncharacterized protein n=1 Tax=Puccinia coronata f. sp. avenae TaxID=200324 RepID=A0A2N5SZZ6_9BASI|nr:hypothetical protein PCANC_06608 [Puccinia coronata f. sp. avenae]PLW46416.1 hypothetical protein PCASD_05496 [Puccinia coronata f. sp. avenae]